MTKTKTVNATVYWFQPVTPDYTCEGCAAEFSYDLCKKLSDQCMGGIWCNTERPTTVPPLEPAPVKGRVTTPQELQLFIKNYQQLAQAVQQAGGSVHILESHTVPQLLQTLARNGITLKATYEARH